MANSIFLDTSGWIALLNASDAMHSRADQIWRGIGAGNDRIVVTDWVIAETGNGLARLRERHSFEEAVRRVFASPRIEVVFVEEELLLRSLELYTSHVDKSWGLVDCASFVVMQDRGIRNAFTSDHHFEQSGFHCLLAV